MLMAEPLSGAQGEDKKKTYSFSIAAPTKSKAKWLERKSAKLP